MTPLVSHVKVAVEPLALWLDSVVALSSLSVNWLGEPWALVAAMLTATVPLTVAALAGLVIDAPSGGGAAPQGAPEATMGDVLSLLMVTAVDIAQFPAASV